MIFIPFSCKKRMKYEPVVKYETKTHFELFFSEFLQHIFVVNELVEFVLLVVCFVVVDQNLDEGTK